MKAPRTPTRHEVHADAVRAKFGRLTAFRLGMAVGRAGENHLPSPYTNERSRRLYEDGVECGLRERASLAGVQS